MPARDGPPGTGAATAKVRKVRLTVATLLAVTLLGSLAADGAGAAKLHPLGRVSSTVTVDRERYVAWVVPKPARRWVRITDTFTGRTYRLRRPKGCTFLQGFAHGRLYFECRHDVVGWAPRLFSARTGRRIPSKGIDAVMRRMVACEDQRNDCAHLHSAVGGHWIHSSWLQRDDERPELYDFTNIRTGEVRRSSDRPDEAEDRDSPRLVRRLCRPLVRERRPETSLATDLFQPFAYTGAFGVRIGWDGFTLMRCGSTKPLLKDPGSYERLSTRHVAWLTVRADRHRILHVMNLRSRRRAAWDVERQMGILTSPSFSLTRHSLYLLDFGDRGSPKGLRLYRSALP